MSKPNSKKVWSRLGIGANFILAVSGVGVSILALRDNNLKMIDLYKKVEAADVSGVGTYDHLKDLQVFVANHMNATPPKLGSNPGIQLVKTYERAKQVESSRVTAERARVYNEAIDFCEVALPKSLLSQRAQCIIDRNGSQIVTEHQIVSDLYRYDFISPTWSPDLAGWSVLISAALIVILLLQIVARLISRVIFTK
jgi:hypothetical protein